MHDRATKFTLDYLTVLEERLGVVWDANGLPYCNLEQINVFTLQRIKNELSDVMVGSPADSAITDSREFGSKFVQTAGFGLVEDFDKFVKVGLLCGKRVVLWDFLFGRILVDVSDAPTYKEEVVRIAHDLLCVRPIVERGGLVILPHPLSWRDNRKTLEFIRQLPRNASPADLGLVSTLSVEDEIALHPYTLFPSPAENWPQHPEALNTHERFSREHYAFHRAIDDILGDLQFAYLDSLTAAELFAVIANREEFHSALRELLLPSCGGSPQQNSEDITRKKKALVYELDVRNKALAERWFATGGAATGFIASEMVLIDAISTSNTTSAIAAALLSLSSALLGFLGQHMRRTNESVLVQAFSAASRRSQS